MEVFLVCVLLLPTKKQQDEDGQTAVIVVQPTAVTAKNEAGAAMKAFKLVPEEHSAKEDRLDVRVVPFRTAVK